MGEVDKVQNALGNGAQINAKDKDGWTPRHVAVQEGHTNIAKALLEHAKTDAKTLEKVLNATNKNGNTPLCLAERLGFDDVVTILESYIAANHSGCQCVVM